MKIGVLIPTHDTHPAMFTYDLAQLASWTANYMPEGSQFGITMVSGTYTHTARMQLMEHALAEGLDYALWLDSDMRFPPELFAVLLQHDVAMVGINYSTREVGGHPVAIERIEEGKYLSPAVLSEDTPLAEVEALGFGAVLMRMADFQGLKGVSRPWFAQEWRPQDGDFLGEDVYFCRLVREQLGVRIFVDQELSLYCSHIGSMEYRLQHLEALS